MIVLTGESTKPRIRDLGYAPGRFAPGPQNSILDVDGKMATLCEILETIAYLYFIGVQVGQVTVHEDSGIHTGVTVILPRGPEETALSPCYAATHSLNAAGEMTGVHMIYEWGHLACVGSGIRLNRR